MLYLSNAPLNQVWFRLCLTCAYRPCSCSEVACKGIWTSSFSFALKQGQWLQSLSHLQWSAVTTLTSGRVTGRDLTIDIHERSQTSYTTPCNGVVSHGTQIGGLCVFADRTRKNKRKTNALTILLHRAAFYTCLSSRSDPSRCGWHTHLTNHGYFDYGKNPKTSNLSSIPESRWRRFWNLPCISMDLTQCWMKRSRWPHKLGYCNSKTLNRY